jgi:hypothetical protein
MINVWLIAVVASLGGLAVFVGLWMEKIGDQDEYQNIDDLRKSKAKRKIGERLVRWGVFAEMLIGFVVASSDGWRAYKNNPLNQPIRSIFAHTEFQVLGKVNEEKWFSDSKGTIPEAPCSWLAQFELFRKNERNAIIFLEGEKRQAWANETCTWYDVNFNMPISVPLWNAEDKIAKQVEELDVLVITARFLPPNSEVLKGSASVTINGTIQKKYIIPSQKSDIHWNIFGVPDSDTMK